MPLVTVSATDTLNFGDAPIGGLPGSLQVAPKFPLSLSSTRDLLNWANAYPSDVVSTLLNNIAPSDVTIALAADPGTRLPLDNFELSVDDEVIFVQSRSGATLSGCVRGVEGSAAASHLSGTTIQLLITALTHNQIVAEIVELEQLLGVQGGHVFPTEIALAPANPGDFTVAHGLGRTPRYAVIQVTSDGLIRFQSARYDATNLYLNASDAGLTGYIEVWV